MAVTIGEFEVVDRPEPAAQKPAEPPPRPAVDERALEALARRKKIRALRIRAS